MDARPQSALRASSTSVIAYTTIWPCVGIRDAWGLEWAVTEANAKKMRYSSTVDLLDMEEWG